MLLLVAAAVRRFFPRPSAGGNATTLRAIYNGANAWADFGNTNVLQNRYLYTRAMDEVLARLSSTSILAWDLPDLLGSVRDISDGPGTAVIDHIKYDSYGNILAETAPFSGDRFKYTAREWDAATSQYFYRARYYSSTAGRFTGQDPLGLAGGDANVVGYTGNSPAARIDPSGLWQDYPISSSGKTPYDPAFGQPPPAPPPKPSVPDILPPVGQPLTPGSMPNPFGKPVGQAAGDVYPAVVDLGLTVGKHVATKAVEAATGAIIGQIASGIGPAIGAVAGKFVRKVGHRIHPAATTDFIGNVVVISKGKTIGAGTVDVGSTIRRIKSGTPHPHPGDGTVYFNREGKLPKKADSDFYTEYVVPTPGHNPGPQRLFVGKDGQTFYTPDHGDIIIPVR